MEKRELSKMLDVPVSQSGSLQVCSECPHLACFFQGRRMFGFSQNCSDIMRLYDVLKEIGNAKKNEAAREQYYKKYGGV